MNSPFTNRVYQLNFIFYVYQTLIIYLISRQHLFFLTNINKNRICILFSGEATIENSEVIPDVGWMAYR